MIIDLCLQQPTMTGAAVEMMGVSSSMSDYTMDLDRP